LGDFSVGLEELLEIERVMRGRGLLTQLSLNDERRFVAYERARRGLRYLETIRLWRARPADFGLLTWLYPTQDLKATDPRDKAFWHYGNLDSSSRDKFPVDYSIDVVAIYRDLTTALMTGDNLVVLSFISVPTKRLLIQLPSWVPGWTAEQYEKPFPVSCIHFNTARDKRGSFSVTENILRIAVVLIDEPLR
jgi:hypothetical protein